MTYLVKDLYKESQIGSPKKEGSVVYRLELHPKYPLLRAIRALLKGLWGSW